MAIAHNLLPRPARILPMAWMPVAAGAGLAAAVALAFHGNARSATWGAIGVSVVWVQLAVLVVWSGAGNLVIGHQATASTAQVLRGMRRRGWNVLHDASLGGRAIDHVVVGPAGVLVVETKWRRDLTPEDLAWAARRVVQSQRDVAHHLHPSLGNVPIVPVVVAWGPSDPDALPAMVDGVPVVHGDRLAAWVGALPDAALSSAELHGAWQHLCGQAGARS